jgi:hypothetical protein
VIGKASREHPHPATADLVSVCPNSARSHVLFGAYTWTREIVPVLALCRAIAQTLLKDGELALEFLGRLAQQVGVT